MDVTIDEAKVILKTTEVYDKSDILLAKRIFAKQIMDYPNIETIKTKFDSLPDTVKADLKKIGIEESNDAFIKDGMITPKRSKQLITGETIFPDNLPIKVPDNYVSDFLKSGAFLLKAINNQIILNMYDPIEHAFEEFVVQYDGKTLYKGKTVGSFILTGNTFKGRAYIEYVGDIQNLGDILYIETPFKDNKIIKLYLN